MMRSVHAILVCALALACVWGCPPASPCQTNADCAAPNTCDLEAGRCAVGGDTTASSSGGAASSSTSRSTGTSSAGATSMPGSSVAGSSSRVTSSSLAGSSMSLGSSSVAAVSSSAGGSSAAASSVMASSSSAGGASSSGAVPPANDFCANAEVVMLPPVTPDGGASVTRVITGSSILAGHELQELTAGCITMPREGSAPQPEVFYTFVPDAAVHLDVLVESTTAATFDSVLYLLRGGCSGTEVACHDDIVANTVRNSHLQGIQLDAMTPYILVVDTWDVGAAFRLTFRTFN
jgi:hypothetical protein